MGKYREMRERLKREEAERARLARERRERGWSENAARSARIQGGRKINAKYCDKCKSYYDDNTFSDCPHCNDARIVRREVPIKRKSLKHTRIDTYWICECIGTIILIIMTLVMFLAFIP